MKLTLDQLRLLFTPLLEQMVRLAVRNLFGLQECIELIKRIYVKEAQRFISETEGRSNVSAISVLSGVHRKDINRILKEPLGNDAANTSILAKIISAWEHTSEFCTTRGDPRALTCSGERNEFNVLCSRVTNDVGPAAIMDQLISQNVIEIRGGKAMLLRSTAPRHIIPEEGVKLLGELVRLLLESGIENIFHRKDSPNFIIRTMYDQIPAPEEGELRDWIKKEGAIFHHRTRQYLAKRDTDTILGAPQSSDRITAAVCTFSIVRKTKL